MATGQIYMLLALVSFSLLGVLHKVADVKHSRPAAINALLAGSSLAFLFAFLVLRGGSAGAGAPSTLAAPASVALLALPFGVSASIAILAFQAGVKHGNIATSWLAINLSAGIPTVASILVYDEPVGTGKAIALTLIPISMFLLWKDKQQAASRDAAAGSTAAASRGAGPS
jgi:EamA domain-containing membrane protein RarD